MAEEILVERQEERSAANILESIVQELGFIIRSEIELARTELSEKAAKAGKSAGMLGSAAVAGLLAAMAAVTTCIAVLAIVIPVWAGALVMTFLLGIFAFAAFSAGRKKLKAVKPVPERTARTLREDVEWAKHRAK
jgi:uncharacterized membrane protein